MSDLSNLPASSFAAKNLPGSLCQATLDFIYNHQAGPPWRYRYASGCTAPTLYSSCYAAMTRHLLGDLDGLSTEAGAAWIATLQAHQDEDGLFRDPLIFDQGWYKDDPLWCGRPHLTCHVMTALACLGSLAEKPFRWLEPWRDTDKLVAWLESRNWGEGVSWTGNEIMNIGTLLQYARDFHLDPRAGTSVEALLEWLSTHHIDPLSGLWGDLDIADPQCLSHAIQAAYHWWTLFFYDGVPPPYLERAIDRLLASQNSLGGFGWGVHNPANPYLSSACEDIDSIDPLCRMMQISPYRRSDIQAALARAAEWVMANQAPDGGFVFIRDQPFEYGHSLLRGERDQGAMFPTWFRTLSLALIGKALPAHPLAQIPWWFVRCPGMQFWGLENC